MTDGDDDNLWLECLAHAKEFYGYFEGLQPPSTKFIPDVMALTEQLFEAVKAASARHKATARARPVVQLKGV